MPKRQRLELLFDPFRTVPEAGVKIRKIPKIAPEKRAGNEPKGGPATGDETPRCDTGSRWLAVFTVLASRSWDSRTVVSSSRRATPQEIYA